MLQMHPGIQRKAAAPLNVTFEVQSLLADSIFSPILFLALSLFYYFSFFVGERETCRVHLLCGVAMRKACESFKTIVLLVSRLSLSLCDNFFY